MSEAVSTPNADPRRSGFQERIVIVTGAAGAVGTAVADYFAQRGARLALLDIQPPAASGHFFVACDLTDPNACHDAVRRVIESLGPVDALANVAGGFAMGPRVHELTDSDWDTMMDMNARTVLNMARAVVPGMLAARRGKIVNIGAGAGQRGAARLGAYSAAKSVVIRLTESLADELKAHGINVNCILPSIIDTPRNRHDMPDADFSRWVTPAQIAAVIGFLASDEASAIHGAALPVAGLV
jgi:NAD(P)-dependent dehydrogenase (short-subunit alcohol dehydrogenase family)